MLWTILIVVLVLILVGALPHWGYVPQGWGYYPAGGLGIIVIILLVLFLMGRI